MQAGSSCKPASVGEVKKGVIILPTTQTMPLIIMEITLNYNQYICNTLLIPLQKWVVGPLFYSQEDPVFPLLRRQKKIKHVAYNKLWRQGTATATKSRDSSDKILKRPRRTKRAAAESLDVEKMALENEKNICKKTWGMIGRRWNNH